MGSEEAGIAPCLPTIYTLEAMGMECPRNRLIQADDSYRSGQR